MAGSSAGAKKGWASRKRGSGSISVPATQYQSGRINIGGTTYRIPARGGAYKGKWSPPKFSTRAANFFTAGAGFGGGAGAALARVAPGGGHAAGWKAFVKKYGRR